MCSYKVVDGKCKLNIKCINYLNAMDTLAEDLKHETQKALQSLNLLLPAPHPLLLFSLHKHICIGAYEDDNHGVCLCGPNAMCVLFFQENSEDDKKRGRSTDSEVSQVSVKMPKPLPVKQECRKLQEHHYLLRLS